MADAAAAPNMIGTRAHRPGREKRKGVTVLIFKHL